MLQCMAGLLFLLWWHIHCYFYLVVMTVDIPGCLACWSVNVMVRGTIFSTVEEEFIVI